MGPPAATDGTSGRHCTPARPTTSLVEARLPHALTDGRAEYLTPKKREREERHEEREPDDHAPEHDGVVEVREREYRRVVAGVQIARIDGRPDRAARGRCGRRPDRA